MPSSNWLSYAEIRRGLILAAFLIPVSVVSFAESPSDPVVIQEEANPEQTEQQPEPEPVTAAPVAVAPPSVIEESAPEQPTPDQPASDKPKDYKKADLDAQVRMAEASEKLFKITERQFWATIIEIALLILAVWAAISAARSAIRAAKAAQAAVTVTQKAVDGASATAEKQLRAYISMKEASIKWVNGIIYTKITLRNGGQTPARDVMAFGKIVFTEEDIFALPDIADMISFADLGPRGIMVIADEDSATPEEWIAICAKKRPYYVWGAVCYFDIFKREQRHTGFRFTMPPGLPASVQKTSLVPCPEGNEST